MAKSVHDLIFRPFLRATFYDGEGRPILESEVFLCVPLRALSASLRPSAEPSLEEPRPASSTCELLNAEYGAKEVLLRRICSFWAWLYSPTEAALVAALEILFPRQSMAVLVLVALLLSDGLYTLLLLDGFDGLYLRNCLTRTSFLEFTLGLTTHCLQSLHMAAASCATYFGV